jgi:hypothetical protein
MLSFADSSGRVAFLTILGMLAVTLSNPARSGWRATFSTTLKACTGKASCTTGPRIDDVTPLVGSADGGTTVTITGGGLTGVTTVNWGGDHDISKCATGVVTDCFKATATKITVYTPPRDDAGADAADGSVYVDIPNAKRKNDADATSVYGKSMITGMTWSSVDVLQPKSLTVKGVGFGATQDTSAVLWGGTPITRLCAAVFDGPKVSCISKWTHKSITLVPPVALRASAVSVLVRIGDADTGVTGTVTSEADNTFYYGPWITEMTPPTASAAETTQVTMTGFGLSQVSLLHWGANHDISTCSVGLVADCFKATASKITVYAPAQASAGTDATDDGAIEVSVEGGSFSDRAHNVFRYGRAVVTYVTTK